MTTYDTERGPFAVWFVNALEERHHIRTLESLEAAERRAERVFRVAEAEGCFGCAVHIVDAQGKLFSSQVVQ